MTTSAAPSHPSTKRYAMASSSSSSSSSSKGKGRHQDVVVGGKHQQLTAG
jgi:hypothetical protein